MSPLLFSRRLFLSRGSQLLSSAATLPLFLDRSAACMAADHAENPAGIGRPDQRVLVVIQLAGGNDGLNTLVPLDNDDYYKARPRLGVAKNAALKLTDDWGLHPAATGFKELYDAGNLAIVHAVGYPNANRSHFRATDIWTSGEPEKLASSGWLGRYCDATCKGQDAGAKEEKIDPATAIAMDAEPPPALVGDKYSPLAFQNGGGGAPGGRGRTGMMDDTIARLNSSTPATTKPADVNSPAARTEEFLQRTVLNARVYADKIRGVSRSVQNKATYPNSPLANDLKLVAQLVASDMPTRIYYVKLGGFDTHSNQAQSHPQLVQQLTGAVAAFVKDLKELGHFDRVMLTTFSEFGRRVQENGSGTDHGEAAPMSLAGGAIKGGLHGTFPGIGNDRLHRGDVAFTTDFRQVYATMLKQWLGADDAKILGGKFKPVELLNAKV